MTGAPSAGRRRQQVTYCLEFGILATVYVAAARFGLTLNAVSGFAAIVWPPTGISLAALLIVGYRLWPAVFVGAALANVLTGAPALVAVGIAAGNRDQESEWERVFRTQARRVGRRPSRTTIRIAGSALHVAYGAGLGALFGALVGESRNRAGVAAAPYGLAVWYANYSKRGLLARLGALPPRRKTIPTAHHMVFGLVTAGAYSRLARRID